LAIRKVLWLLGLRSGAGPRRATFWVASGYVHGLVFGF